MFAALLLLLHDKRSAQGEILGCAGIYSIRRLDCMHMWVVLVLNR